MIFVVRDFFCKITGTGLLDINFFISHSSVVDDSIEEHKLLSQRHEKARLKELAGDEWEEDEGGGVSEEDSQTVVQLMETIKIERDQKVPYILCVCRMNVHT